MENENKDEAIGFHKGAINTLVNERNELIRIVQVTETLVQAHIKALEELGVKLNVKDSNPASYK
ncbi:hypothetical protein HYW75_01750 [Candidatus Pacearchaeota archaeon]|nr:hypothetical protein [Candidatus Pacearchaeota archaeon]